MSAPRRARRGCMMVPAEASTGLRESANDAALPDERCRRRPPRSGRGATTQHGGAVVGGSDAARRASTGCRRSQPVGCLVEHRTGRPKEQGRPRPRLAHAGVERMPSRGAPISASDSGRDEVDISSTRLGDSPMVGARGEEDLHRSGRRVGLRRFGGNPNPGRGSADVASPHLVLLDAAEVSLVSTRNANDLPAPFGREAGHAPRGGEDCTSTAVNCPYDLVEGVDRIMAASPSWQDVLGGWYTLSRTLGAPRMTLSLLGRSVRRSSDVSPSCNEPGSSSDHE